MTTAGNSLTENGLGESFGNSLTEKEVRQETVTDPTLANADGTYDVTIVGVYNIAETDDVLGLKWTGNHRVSVDSVSGNVVSVLFESPSGVDTFENEADGAVTGTLTVTVRT